MCSAPTRYVGAIDQGTSSTRFSLFNEASEMVASHQIENPMISLQPGWAEHDPLFLLSITKRCIDEVMQNFTKQDVVSIGVTNQRESVVIWDRVSGLPLYNVILWLDSRTTSVCSRLEKNFGTRDYFRSICGLPISTYFSAPKILWLIENVPSVAKAIADETCYIGTIDSWLIWNLTGGISGGAHVTDVTNASRTMLFDLHSLAWSQEICTKLQIPLSCLPQIISNCEIVGVIDTQSSIDGVPISGCIGDQHAAMLGQLCFNKGDTKTTYGTGAFMLMNTGSELVQSKHGLLTTITYKLGPKEPVQYALEGSVAYAGAVNLWLRDNLNLVSNVSEIGELAKSVNDNGGVYFVPAFCGLFAPYWRDDARGIIIGLTQHSSKAHLCRAALEFVCFAVKEVIGSMESDFGTAVTNLKVDGGMSVSDFIMQLQAEVLHTPVWRPIMPETTVLGAAIAAGLTSGFWSSIQDMIAKRSSQYQRFQPKLERCVFDKFFSEYQRAAQRCIGWIDTEDLKNG